MTPAERISILRRVGFFSELDEPTMAEVAALAELRCYRANQRILTELEFGDDVYIVARGQVQISVCPESAERLVLSEGGPGAAFGEMASLTGELRSATVVALTEVEVLVLSDLLFDGLRARRPQIAVSLVNTLAARLAQAERTLATLLDTEVSTSSSDQSRNPCGSRLAILWRELVVSHQKDMAFLVMVAFAVTLAAVRSVIVCAFKYDLWPSEVIRVAYVLGVILAVLSACAAILTFRPKWRRVLILMFGVGAALIVNELGVMLAFDIFYKGTELDPAQTFDIEQLYRRAEPIRAAVIGLVALLQAVYLWEFYRRAWQILVVRLRRFSKGSVP